VWNPNDIPEVSIGRRAGVKRSRFALIAHRPTGQREQAVDVLSGLIFGAQHFGIIERAARATPYQVRDLSWD
jgi:hypothetical protein